MMPSGGGTPQTPQGPGGQQPPPADDMPWYCKTLCRAVGTIGGLIAMAFGIWVCVSLKAMCIVGGMLQILFGFLTVCLEAPCLCIWFDFIGRFQQFSDSRKHWHKAILYIGIGITPIAMCPGVSTIFGAGLIGVCGVLYGVMAFGKKADRDTMLARAGGGQANDAWDVNLVDNEKNPNVMGP